MIFSQYAEQSKICNVSVNGETSETGTYAFRGDIVIEEGDIADAQGRRHPPKSTVKQAVVLAKGDKITALAGAIDDIGFLPGFMGMYKADIAEDAHLLLYVRNISKPMIINLDDQKITVIQHDEGAVWTTLMDDVRLEKSDFKGQSAEDKVITMVTEGLGDFKPKYEEKAYNDALSFTIEVSKEARGPI